MALPDIMGRPGQARKCAASRKASGKSLVLESLPLLCFFEIRKGGRVRLRELVVKLGPKLAVLTIIGIDLQSCGARLDGVVPQSGVHKDLGLILRIGRCSREPGLDLLAYRRSEDHDFVQRSGFPEHANRRLHGPEITLSRLQRWCALRIFETRARNLRFIQ